MRLARSKRLASRAIYYTLVRTANTDTRTGLLLITNLPYFIL